MDTQNLLDRRLGMIAINKGYATRQEVDRALLTQKCLNAEGEHNNFIGDILVNLGVLTAVQRDEILAIQKDLKKKTAHKAQPSSGSKTAESAGGIDTKIALEISEDRTEAYICPQEKDYKGIRVDDIRQLLKKEGIVYGIIDDEEISAHLSQETKSSDPWLIAEGKKSIAMKVSKIKCCLGDVAVAGNTPEYSGTTEHDRINEVADVKKGDLIAQLVLAEAGSPGVDVYGQPMPLTLPDDIIFQCANGAKKTEDGLKVVSEIDGRPELSCDGTICVFPVVQISGNVDHETGNLEFDGHVEIEGVIEDGLCVKARTLKAKRIDKANVEVEGDIHIIEGILEMVRFLF